MNQMPDSRGTIIKAVVIIAVVIILDAVLLFSVYSVNSDTIEDKYLRAREYAAQMDYNNSIAIYNQIISENNGGADAYAELADIYMLKGNEEKAYEVLLKGINRLGKMNQLVSKMSELFPNRDFTEVYSEELEIPDETTTSDETSEFNTFIVPDFVGLNKQEAMELAESKNIKIKIEYDKNSDYPADIIFKQSHEVDSEVLSRTIIQVYVGASSKKPTVSVPDFSGKTVDEVKAWCAENEIELKEVDSIVGSDKILSQNPEAGVEISAGNTIIVTH